MTEPETPRIASSFPRSPNGNLRRRGDLPPPPPPSAPSASSSFSPFRTDRPLQRNAPSTRRGSISAQKVEPRNEDIVAKTGNDIPPLIPFEIIDGPTQRVYVVGLFALLTAWKLYDWSRLFSEHGDSMTELWFVMKWLLIDGVAIWMLPALRIPWMTPSGPATLGIICAVSCLNLVLSLRYIPGMGTVSAILSVFAPWGKGELSISERSVKWYDIVHNSSHIMGKYTVHILPEGAAQLNPEGQCYCVNPTTPAVTIPIRINGTEPIEMKIMRIDLSTSAIEYTILGKKEIKKLFKKATKEDNSELRYLPFTVKQPGLYRLFKVKDITELEVRVQASEALVVNCPTASVKASSGKRASDMCKGEMSNLSINVEGLAPLSVTYSRTVRGTATVFNVQRIHPENYESPLLSGFVSDGRLAESGDEGMHWARTQTMSIPLNETLGSNGEWMYEVDKVTDACGNEIDYKKNPDDEDSWSLKTPSLSHAINVHDRPLARFTQCDPQRPMHLPRGKSASLPVSLSAQAKDGPFHLQLAFTPFNKLNEATEHSSDYQLKSYTAKSVDDAMMMREPGLYTLNKLTSKFCDGEILEPATCLVITPPEPSLTVEFDEIRDKCTASSIGLTADVTLVGSPPFDLYYRMIKDNGSPTILTLKIDKARHQVRFTPEEPGHYAYEFFRLDDANYEKIKIEPAVRQEQTVKPLAGATFIDATPQKSCVEESVEFDVKMQGTAPLTLHYDLIHRNKRVRFSEKNITGSIHKITTPPLKDGGDWSVALIAVEDQSGCKVALDSEAKVNVRFQRPKVAFAPVEGKFNMLAMEGKSVNIPMRLTGEGPWSVRVRNLDKDGPVQDLYIREPNQPFQAHDVGTYHLESVRDSGCPGTVTESQSKFTISWIARPQLRIPPSISIKQEGDILKRTDICEGDEDAVEVAFTGSPPFKLTYEERHKAEGAKSWDKSVHTSSAALGITTVRLQSQNPGLYRYVFSQVSDSLYDDPKDKNMRQPITLEQRVFPKPSATFVNPQKSYKYCMHSASGEDSNIPIELTGLPPFAITFTVKHLNTGKYDIVHVPNIDAHTYNFRIPSDILTIGEHLVSVSKVKDSRGCLRKLTTGSVVRVAVADMPTITPNEQRNDYCVGERIAFSIAGVPPFAVEYKWNGQIMKATSQPSQFVRVAERPGNFTITGLQDSASDCKVNLGIDKVIHEVPSVRISEGIAVIKGIPQGDQAEINFHFFGTPPFTFTYTRSEIAPKGKKGRILEMHSQTTDSYEYSLFASQEGTYEVISIEDRFCSYTASSAAKRHH